jgi:hypothetical protein
VNRAHVDQLVLVAITLVACGFAGMSLATTTLLSNGVLRRAGRSNWCRCAGR